MDLKEYLKEKRELIDTGLKARLPKDDGLLSQAVRYSALAPGKRLRAVLVMASAESVKMEAISVLDAACAVEMAHAFSLVHDDLPCMDDDDLRRGLPTSHKKFGEAVAVLAGDSLLALAFETLGKSKAAPAAVNMALVDLAAALGCRGMALGQTMDILSEGKLISLEELFCIHARKTGDLISASCRLGAVLSEAPEKDIAVLSEYGRHIGMAFQIKDDILDIEGCSQQIGKPQGSDLKRKKATFPSLIGLEDSKKALADHITAAMDCLNSFGVQAEPLRLLAGYIGTRTK